MTSKLSHRTSLSSPVKLKGLVLTVREKEKVGKVKDTEKSQFKPVFLRATVSDRCIVCISNCYFSISRRPKATAINQERKAL